MLKAKSIKDKHLVKVRASGNVPTLAAETAAIIKVTYENLYKQSPAAAEMYKKEIIGLVIDPRTPVFDRNAPV